MKYLVTRLAGYLVSSDGNKSFDSEEIISIRDWVVNAKSHQMAVQLAGGPIWPFSDQGLWVRYWEENGKNFERWSALTFKELAKREGGNEDARSLWNAAVKNPGKDVGFDPLSVQKP